MKMNKNTNDLSQLKAGDSVYVLERDEDDQPVGYSSYMFLAKANDFIIATPWIDEFTDADETLAYLAEESADNYGTDLVVLPVSDCFKTGEDVIAALNGKE